MTEIYNGVEGTWTTIFREDAQHGDILRVTGPNQGYGLNVEVSVTKKDSVERFVPSPPEPELPTEPGYYEDNEGDVWFLSNGDDWYLNSSNNGFEESEEYEAQEYLPFKRLNFTSAE